MTTLAFVVKNLLVPITTAVLAYLVFALDSSVKTLDGQLKAREAVRLERSDDREMRFKIYEAVTNSLESADARRQRIAQALVVSMLEDDDRLRTGLLEVFTAQGATEVQKEAAQALEESRRFTTQQQLVGIGDAVTTADWRSYNVDVFWCTAVGDAARIGADRVLSSLQAAGVRGRLRQRELPPSINASPGYQISGLIIRREVSEANAAESLKQAIDQVYSPQQFSITGSRQSTPGYLSVFVCQAR